MATKEFLLAQDKGVSAEGAVDFLPHTESNGRIVVDYDVSAAKFAKDAKIAMDAAMTTANVNVPAVYTTYLDPQIIPILFAVQNATKLFPEQRRGDWTNTTMQFPVEELSGGVTPYSDMTEAATSDVNYEYPSRDNFIFQTMIKYGQREEAIAAKSKLAYAAGKQRAAAFTIANAHNLFALYGVKGKAIYGSLNDPNLPAAVSTISVSGQSTWAGKIAADSSNAANIIFNDINKLYADICARNGGHVSADSPMVLAVSNAVSPLLNTLNSFGLSPRTMLKQTFPNMEIVELPQLHTGGDKAILIVKEVDGFETGFCGYSEKYRAFALVQSASSFKQKVIGGTWGTVICRPSFVGILSGIS